MNDKLSPSGKSRYAPYSVFKSVFSNGTGSNPSSCHVLGISLRSSVTTEERFHVCDILLYCVTIKKAPGRFKFKEPGGLVTAASTLFKIMIAARTRCCFFISKVEVNKQQNHHKLSIRFHLFYFIFFLGTHSASDPATAVGNTFW